MTIKGLLLAGASLATFGASSAYAERAPTIHVAALHPGHAVVKTALHSSKVSNLTSTLIIYSSVSTAADYLVKTHLIYTYYAYYDSGSFCGTSNGRTKQILASKTTAYAKLNTAIESYSEGCGTPTDFYGITYRLTTKKAVGKVDSFQSDLHGKNIHFEGEVYDINTYMDISVFIES